MNSFLLFLIMCTLSLVFPVNCPGVENVCDPDLKTKEDFAFSYRYREDRCEGLYIREVAGTPLLVASLTSRFEDFTPQSGNNLLVSFRSPGDTYVRIRACGLRRKLYYRMDTIVQRGHKSYRWPLDILNALNITRKDLGLIAWAEVSLGGEMRKVYLPVCVSQGSSSISPISYQMLLFPEQELVEVYVTLAGIDQQGRQTSKLMEAKPLGYGYYPAERPVLITIPPLPSEGFYCIDIGVVLKSGGSYADHLFVYHPG